MNKKLQFKSLILLVALLLGGVGSAWAAEKTTDVALNNGIFETDHITWTVGNAITIQQLQGTGSNAVNDSYIAGPRLYKGHILSFTAASGYAIKSISITYSGNHSGNSMTVGTVVSEDKVTDNTTDVNRTWATASGGTHVVSSVSASGLSQIYIQNVASKTSTQLRPTTISITYIAPEGEKETAIVEISSTSIFEKKTATVTTDGPAVTLSTSDASTATVSGTTITGVKAGSVDITATWQEGTVEGKTYASGSQVFNITVEENNAVTIDEQGNYIFDFTKNYWDIPTDYAQDENSYTSPDYAIILKGDKYKFSSSYLIFGQKNASLTLPAFTFDVEKIEVVGNSDASSAVEQNIFVGDNPVSTPTTGAKGTNVYKIASGYQAAGNIYTIKVTSAHNTQITKIYIYKKSATTVADPTFSIESGNYATAQNVEIRTTTVGATIYYTLDGSNPTNNSTEYKGAIEVSDDAIIKAIAYLGNTASSISEVNIKIGTAVTFTLNDKDSIEALGIALPESGKGTKVERIEKDGISIAATTAEGKTDTRIYQGSGQSAGVYDFRIYAGGTLTFTAGSNYIKKIEFTGNNLGNLSGNNYTTGTWAGSAQSVTLAATGTATIYTITVTCGNPPAVEAPVSSVQTGTYYNTQSVELTCTTVGAEIYYTIDDTAPTTTSTKYTGPIEVSETTTIKAIAATSAGESTITEVTLTFLPPIDITLTKDMETYCGTTPLDFSKSGLKVYTAKVNEGVVVLTEVTNGQVPAKRGVILTGKAGSYKAIPIESADNLQNNELYGLSSDGTVSYEYNNTYNYILQDGVFKKATGLKLKGGKAYLKTSFDVTKAGTRELKIVFDGEATAISAVKTAAADQNVYDLQGRKVTAPSKGLYIINGKKMIVK